MEIYADKDRWELCEMIQELQHDLAAVREELERSRAEAFDYAEDYQDLGHQLGRDQEEADKLRAELAAVREELETEKKRQCGQCFHKLFEATHRYERDEARAELSAVREERDFAMRQLLADSMELLRRSRDNYISAGYLSQRVETYQRVIERIEDALGTRRIAGEGE